MSSKTTTKEAGASRTGRRYDETFKRDAVRLRQQTGRPRAQVARDLGVSEVSLSAWEGGSARRSGPPQGRARIHDPSARHGKKGYGHHGPGPEEHFAMVAAMQHGNEISELWEAFGVSRSGYYDHLRKPAGQRRREDEALRPKIAAAFHESRQTYGTPRLRVALGEKEGLGISRERIARLMRELGLQPLQKGTFTPRTTQSDPAAAAAPNLLLDRPATTAPDQVWVSDITFIPTGEGWLYLAAVMDLHSRRILGWATASHMRAELAAEALQRARFTRANSILLGTIAHSDRGCQYSSGEYRADLALMGMIQSMSRTANCYDNATMESFWASLKTEALRSIPATHAEARLLIHDYIDAFYNTRRHHSSLDFKSPIDFERSLSDSLN